MKNLFSESMRQEIAASRAIATVTIENTESAKPLAEALLAGGIRCIEITLRTPAALESMQIVAQAFPEMQVMAGTVIAPQNARGCRATY